MAWPQHGVASPFASEPTPTAGRNRMDGFPTPDGEQPGQLVEYDPILMSKVSSLEELAKSQQMVMNAVLKHQQELVDWCTVLQNQQLQLHQELLQENESLREDLAYLGACLCRANVLEADETGLLWPLGRKPKRPTGELGNVLLEPSAVTSIRRAAGAAFGHLVASSKALRRAAADAEADEALRDCEAASQPRWEPLPHLAAVPQLHLPSYQPRPPDTPVNNRRPSTRAASGASPSLVLTPGWEACPALPLPVSTQRAAPGPGIPGSHAPDDALPGDQAIRRSSTPGESVEVLSPSDELRHGSEERSGQDVHFVVWR